LIKRIALLAALALPTLIAASPAQAATSCTVYQRTPVYSNGTVSSTAEVDCFNSGSIGVYMESWLTRDNVQVDHIYGYGGATDYGYWERVVSAPNMAGNQQWCASTVVTNASGTVLDSDNACESQSWFAR